MTFNSHGMMEQSDNFQDAQNGVEISQIPGPLEQLQSALEKRGMLSCSPPAPPSSSHRPWSPPGSVTAVPDSTPAESKPRKHRCKNCGFVAFNKNEFWRHTATHMKTEKILKCDHCPFVTEYKHHLEYHVRNHFNCKPFKCDKCSYNCVNKSMLNSHMKSHSNVYQYRCADCEYATKYCHSLKIHLRRHAHAPALVLNEDGTQNIDSIIDVYGTRRGPRAKKRKPSKPEDGAGKSDALSPYTPTGPYGERPSFPFPLQYPPPLLPLFYPNLIHNNVLLPRPPFAPSFQCTYCDYKTNSKEAFDRHAMQHAALENRDLAKMYGMVRQVSRSPDANGDPKLSEPKLDFPLSKDDSRSSASSPISLTRGFESSPVSSPFSSSPKNDFKSTEEEVLSPLDLSNSRGRVQAEVSTTNSPQQTTTSRHRRKGQAFKLSRRYVDWSHKSDVSLDDDEDVSFEDEETAMMEEGLKDEEGSSKFDLLPEPKTLIPTIYEKKQKGIYKSTKDIYSPYSEIYSKLESERSQILLNLKYNQNQFNLHKHRTSRLQPPVPPEHELNIPKRRSPSMNEDEEARFWDNAKCCSFCKMAFKDRIMYTLHMQYHSFQDPSTCNFCSKKYNDPVEFYMHFLQTPHC